MNTYVRRRSRLAGKDPASGPEDAQFLGHSTLSLVQRIVVTAAVLAGLAVLWTLRDLVLVLFGAIVVAVGLRGTVTYLADRLRVRRRGALGLIVTAAGALAAGIVWFFGPGMAANLAVVSDELPRALDQAVGWLSGQAWGLRVIQGWEAEPGLSQLPRILDMTRVTFAVGASGVVMLIAATYLAVRPADYLRLVLDWVPRRHRVRAWQVLRAVESALKRWLAGQAAAVAFTAVGMAGVLWSLRVPLGGTVAVAAALLTLVPFLGAIAGAVLVTVMAFTHGVQTAGYAAASWLLIHAISEYGLLPQFQKWSVNIPPVASIFTAIAWASVFGLYGLMLAGPLTVSVVAAARAIRGGDV